MAANITVEQYRGAFTLPGGVVVPIPSGLLTSQLVTTTGTNDYSAVIRDDTTVVAVTSDVSSNVFWDYSATPSSGQATTAHPILPSGSTRFFEIKGNGTMKLVFRNVA